MSLGETIKKIRNDKGYSIMKIRELTGLSKSTISDLENDKSSPTAETLQKIANALNVPVEDFFKTESISENKLKELDGKYNKDYKENEIEDKDIDKIIFARNMMPMKDKEKMMKILEATFEEYFKNNRKE